jgi:HK97 family phage prohead protease
MQPFAPTDNLRVPRLVSRSVQFRATDAADESGDGRTLEGYAAVFGQATRIDSWEGEFDEEIVRGAFRKTLRERTPVLQFDHGRDWRTGSVPIGALNELREDDEGLFVRARLFDNDVVEPIRQAIDGGAIDGMSFRFKVVRDEWRDADGKAIKADELAQLLWSPGDRGPLRRTIKEVELFELGPVVFPAYEGTSVGVRSPLAGLSDEDRQALIQDLAAELRGTVTPAANQGTDAAPEGTSDPLPDAGTSATSGPTHAERLKAVRRNRVNALKRGPKE